LTTAQKKKKDWIYCSTTSSITLFTETIQFGTRNTCL